MDNENSFAMELLTDFKKQNKRMFVIWIITFLTLIGLTCYTVYLLNDISVEETTTQEVYDIDSVGGSIINGDNYGEDKTDKDR